MIANSFKCTLRRFGTSVGKNSEAGERIKSFDEIPGPKLPSLAQKLRRHLQLNMGTSTNEEIHLTYARMYDQYGPLVKQQVHRRRTILHVFDPVDISLVFTASSDTPIRRSHRALLKYRRERPKFYNGGGLASENGDEWKRMHDLFSKVLLSEDAALSYSGALEDVTNDLIARMTSLLDDKSEVDVQPLLFNWALECVGIVALNRRLGCLTAEGNREADILIKAARATHTAVGETEESKFACMSYRRLVHAQDAETVIVEKYLNEAMEDFFCGRNTNSIVGRLLNVKILDKSVDKKDVFTMMMDMFLAGVETTAYTLAFGLYRLALNSRAQDKLFEELKVLLPRKNSRFSAVRQSEYPYLKNVIRETLRVNPPSIGTGRVLEMDLVLSGYHVPEGTMTIIQNQVASNQSQNIDNPDQFNPDRWADKDRYTRWVNNPFGFGSRTCVGRVIANREQTLGFAKIVRHFDISYHYDRIGTLNKLVNVPDKPVMLRLKERKE